MAHDRSQIEYYEAVTRRYPGRILSEARGVTERHGQGYWLKGYSELYGSVGVPAGDCWWKPSGRLGLSRSRGADGTRIARAALLEAYVGRPKRMNHGRTRTMDVPR